MCCQRAPSLHPGCIWTSRFASPFVWEPFSVRSRARKSHQATSIHPPEVVNTGTRSPFLRYPTPSVFSPTRNRLLLSFSLVVFIPPDSTRSRQHSKSTEGFAYPASPFLAVRDFRAYNFPRGLIPLNHQGTLLVLPFQLGFSPPIVRRHGGFYFVVYYMKITELGAFSPGSPPHSIPRGLIKSEGFPWFVSLFLFFFFFTITPPAR